jgi:5-methylthioadenosine/S-adenosylhomocysteine deaminase
VPFADRVAVASCTKVYMKHAHTTTPVRLLHDAGLTVGLGTDGPASHNTLDVLESMRMMSLKQKDDHLDATWLTSAHALDLATRQSAAAFGLDDSLATLVLSVKSSDVTTVLVEGRVLVENGRLLTLDVMAAADELIRRIPELTDRSRGSIQDYAP